MEFSFDPKTGVLTNGRKEYRFKSGKNTYLAVKKMFTCEKGEWIDIVDLIDAIF